MKRREEEPNKHFRQWSFGLLGSLSSPQPSSPHPERRRKHAPPKHWYTIKRLPGTTNQMPIKTHITMKTSNPTTKQTNGFQFFCIKKETLSFHLNDIWGKCVKHIQGYS
jgi:hypothetical protein